MPPKVDFFVWEATCYKVLTLDHFIEEMMVFDKYIFPMSFKGRIH